MLITLHLSLSLHTQTATKKNPLVCRLCFTHHCSNATLIKRLKVFRKYIHKSKFMCMRLSGADLIHQRFVAFIEAFSKFLVRKMDQTSRGFLLLFGCYFSHTFCYVFQNIYQSKANGLLFLLLFQSALFLSVSDTHVIAPRSDKRPNVKAANKVKSNFSVKLRFYIN